MSSTKVQQVQPRRVQQVQSNTVTVNHNGKTRNVSTTSPQSREQEIKIVMYLIGAVLLGVLIYFLWKKLSSFWLFRDIGSALGLVNKAGRGTSNFFRGLF